MNEFRFDVPDRKPESQPLGRIVYAAPTQEAKYPTGRALAAAFWISYFALHWLLLLEVVETTTATAGMLVIHFAVATLLSINIAARDHALSEKK